MNASVCIPMYLKVSVYVGMDGWMDGWMDNGWMDGWMDGQWMDGWMDGWMDKTDGACVYMHLTIV